jgi:hypothetical protein
LDLEKPEVGVICQRCGRREATERIHKTAVNLTGVGPTRDESVEELCGPCLAGIRVSDQPSPGDYIEFIKERVAAGETRAEAIKQAAELMRQRLI